MSKTRTNEDIFGTEKQVLSQISSVLDNKKYRNELLFDELEFLNAKYQKLLNQVEVIFHVSDNNHKMLKVTQDKLYDEINERKRVEQELEDKVEELLATKQELEETNQKLEVANKKLEEANRKLAQISYIDQLTGLPNRRHYESVISKEWRIARRRKYPISIIMIDIDDFKVFNDTYGHIAGDNCLKIVAQGLSGCLNRASDFITRYGGEEFVVVLPDTNVEGSAHVAEIMRQSIEDTIITLKSSDEVTHVTISLGVATVEQFFDLSPDDVLDEADQALYQAKNQGKNRVCQVGVMSRKELE